MRGWIAGRQSGYEINFILTVILEFKNEALTVSL